MSFLERNATRIYYETWTPTRPVSSQPVWITLVNGYTRGLSDFKLFGRVLCDAGIHVLAIDNRGAGSSTVAMDVSAFSLDDMVQDILLIWQQEKILKSAVLGISMGGLISQMLVSQNASLITELILISTADHVDRTPVGNGSQGFTDDEKEIQERLISYFSSEFLEKNRLLVVAMAKQMAKNFASTEKLHGARLQLEAMREFAEIRTFPTGLRTLIIHGSDDKVIPVESARKLHTDIPQSRLHIMENAGHLLIAERPKELYALVRDFLLDRQAQ